MILRDYIQIEPDKALANLSKRDRVEVLKTALEHKDESKRGLKVTLDLSHAGRRINHRVYSPWGQRDAVNGFTQPFPKPMIMNHNIESDPIGRAIQAQYLDMSGTVAGFFGHTKDLMSLHKAFETKDYETLSDQLNKSNLLLNPKWPGIGALRVTVRVTDKDAIEKFLDGRYMTFSGGFDTNAMVCSHCLNDWRKGNICEHRPGTIVDGKPVVLLCGSYEPREITVTSAPADDLAMVVGMELTDSLYGVLKDQEREPAYLTDSVIEIEDDFEFSVDYFHKKGSDRFLDALNGETQFEVKTLVELHDSLHMRFDFSVKYGEHEIPKDIFKIHAKLHEMALAGSYRDSFINGVLDHYSASGEETGEFEYAESEEPMDSVETKLTKLEDMFKLVFADELMDFDEEVDWVALDKELDEEMGDAKLSAEAREKLDKRAFCGPGRSFPVNDCAHATAALRLLGRSKYSDATKAKIKACVNRKRESMGCDIKQELDTLKLDHTNLRNDYVHITSEYEKLQQRLNSVVNSSLKALNRTADSLDTGIELIEQFTEPKNLKPVTNPSIASESSLKLDKRSDFEKTIINKYREIHKTSGVRRADQYLAGVKKYLPRDFNLKDLLSEE